MPKRQDRTYVVIGSNCFTGSSLVDGLLETHPDARVIGISRSPEYAEPFLPYKRRRQANFTFHRIDLVKDFTRLVELLNQEEPAVVFNVAALSEVALSNERPVEYFETNTVGVVRLADFLRRAPYLERYVHVSSAEMLGPCHAPATESAPLLPSTPYAVSKAAADMYLETLDRNFGFKSLVCRSTNVYGKHQQLFKIIPRTVIYLKLNRIIELHGGGTSIKSFVHIRDVVRGMLMALERNASGVFHFSTDDDRTVAGIVRAVCARMGRDYEKSTRVVGERLGQDARYWLDCRKARDELKWEPRVDFNAAVDEVIEWIESNWSFIAEQPLNYVHKQ